jgi:shikimate kinase
MVISIFSIKNKVTLQRPCSFYSGIPKEEEKEMTNLILVGMPACGKSIVGVVLAKTLNMDFMDTDILIQTKEGRLLQEMIDLYGNDYFCRAEENVLRHIDAAGTVIATGGSAIHYPEALTHLKKNGVVIYLKVSLETILERLDNITTRGVTLAPGETLTELYHRRIPLYEARSDITIEADKLSVEQTVEEIMKVKIRKE